MIDVYVDDRLVHSFREITEEEVVELVKAKPGLKQPQLLELLYPEEMPLDGREKPNPIKRPHLQLEQHLKSARTKKLVDFLPKGAAGGWKPL